MCGISGTTRVGDGTPLTIMNRLMVHRGPDDEGMYIDPRARVGLAARRLSIIDIAGGHQPISNEDHTVWAVLNGEVYNHEQLRQRLIGRGHQFRSRSDTEVLVHAYEEFGDDLVHACEGMYAFAMWDERRRRLLLARDRFGEKPLFYAKHDGGLTFASELTALMAGCRMTAEISLRAVDAFFLLGYIPGPGTIVKGAQQVPPGHTLVWEQASGAVAIRQYWAPLPMPTQTQVPARELVEETRELLESSVRSRMISDVPLGVFLSGGVDSSLVTALAARHSSRPIKTFTVGYDVGGVNEIEPARRVARALGTDHYEFILSEDDIRRTVPSLLAAPDQPIGDQALIPSHALARAARADVTVAVGGEGADELFGGYPRYRWLDRSVRFHQLVPSSVVAVGNGLIQRLPPVGRGRRLQVLLHPGTTQMRHFEWISDHRAAMRPELYGERLRPLLTETAHFEGILDPGPGLDGDVADIMRIDQTGWLPDDVLVKADRSSMLVSLEVRTPYLDRRLAEFAFSVPSSIHCDRGGKRLLREVLAGLLPEGVANRPKVGFRVPAADWLQRPLAATLSNQIAEGRLFEEGWFERAAVTRLAKEHAEGKHDWTHVLWPVLALGLWLDRFRGAR
jgi:asparagine synthase (glutamine-hydrolysing)